MPSPFPGMDPWLEDVEVWRGVHARLITKSSDLLQPQLHELGYFIDIEERIYVEESERHVVPDLAIIERPRQQPATSGVAVLQADEPVRVRSFTETEIRERFLQIFDAKGRQLITQIEFISHTNKNQTRGRTQYIQKRNELKAAGVNVVEIDLLRKGVPVVDVSMSGLEGLRPWDYLACVARAGEAERELYCVTMRMRLPRIRIPLRTSSPDVVLDIQSAFISVYDAGPYPDRLDYNQPPDPVLSVEDEVWADELLRAGGLRA